MKRLCVFGLLFLFAGCAKSTNKLIHQLKSSDERARLQAIHALDGRRKDAETIVPALAHALRDEDVYVRRDAARALRHFGADAKAAVPALVAALDDEESSVRRAARNALKEIDPERSH